MTTVSEVSEVMEYMPYGLYVIGSKMDNECNGMIADWVMQSSFEPHMVTIGLENNAQTLANIRATGIFTVNFLSQSERAMHLAAHFAQPYLNSKIGGPSARGVHHKLNETDYTLSATGCPILKDAMAWLECRAVNFVPSGDHTLVLGEVVGSHLIHAEEPLTSTFTGWNYSG